MLFYIGEPFAIVLDRTQRIEKDNRQNVNDIIYSIKPLEVEESPKCDQPSVNDNASAAIVMTKSRSHPFIGALIQWRDFDYYPELNIDLR